MRPGGNREQLEECPGGHRQVRSHSIRLRIMVLSVLSDGGLPPLGRRQASRVEQSLSQQVFDLAIEAPQIVVGPPLQRAMDLGVEAQEKRFAF